MVQDDGENGLSRGLRHHLQTRCSSRLTGIMHAVLGRGADHTRCPWWQTSMDDVVASRFSCRWAKGEWCPPPPRRTSWSGSRHDIEGGHGSLGHVHRPSNGRSSCNCFFLVGSFPPGEKEWPGGTGHCAALLFGLSACPPEVARKTG